MSTTVIPKKYQVLSGSALKLIAVITMIIDHIGAFLLVQVPETQQPLFANAPDWLTLYNITRTVGRAAFPIFCFLVAEGARYTHSRKRYGISLLVCAVISEFAWNLAHNGTLRFEKQNVFFTLLLGYLCICICDRYRKDPLMLAIGAACMIVTALYVNADYGVKGMALIPMMYVLREYPFERTVVGCGCLNSPVREIPGFLLLWLYNGERGFIKGKISKYAFYAIYPVHIFILYLIHSHLFGY